MHESYQLLLSHLAKNRNQHNIYNIYFYMILNKRNILLRFVSQLSNLVKLSVAKMQLSRYITFPISGFTPSISTFVSNNELLHPATIRWRHLLIHSFLIFVTSFNFIITILINSLNFSLCPAHQLR